MEKNKTEVKRERTKRDNKEERCVLDTYTGRALSVLNKAFIRWTIQLNSLPYSAWKTMIVKASEIEGFYVVWGRVYRLRRNFLVHKKIKCCKKVCIFKIKQLNLVHLDSLWQKHRQIYINLVSNLHLFQK